MSFVQKGDGNLLSTKLFHKKAKNLNVEPRILNIELI